MDSYYLFQTSKTLLVTNMYHIHFPYSLLLQYDNDITRYCIKGVFLVKNQIHIITSLSKMYRTSQEMFWYMKLVSCI